VRLSASETKLLAAQPFIALDLNLLKLEWRTVPGFERYEVSSLGHVRRGFKLLKQTKHKAGHLSVTLYSDDGDQWRVGVHRLVALAFIGLPPRDKPLACHKNGRPWENVATNLYWGDHIENAADARNHRLSAPNPHQDDMLTTGQIQYRNKRKMLARLAVQ
jgi:hypothetical protein